MVIDELEAAVQVIGLTHFEKVVPAQHNKDCTIGGTRAQAPEGTYRDDEDNYRLIRFRDLQKNTYIVNKYDMPPAAHGWHELSIL